MSDTAEARVAVPAYHLSGRFLVLRRGDPRQQPSIAARLCLPGAAENFVDEQQACTEIKFTADRSKALAACGDIAIRSRGKAVDLEKIAKPECSRPMTAVLQKLVPDRRARVDGRSRVRETARHRTLWRLRRSRPRLQEEGDHLANGVAPHGPRSTQESPGGAALADDDGRGAVTTCLCPSADSPALPDAATPRSPAPPGAGCRDRSCTATQGRDRDRRRA